MSRHRSVYYSDFFSSKHLVAYLIIISLFGTIFFLANTIVNNATKSCVKPVINATTKHLVAKLYKLGAHKVSFQTVDNHTIEGFAFYRPQAKFSLVVCHGYQCSKETGWRLVKMFPDCNILLFDFRGHGQSSSSTISFGWHEYNDVLAALRFAHSHEPFNHMPVVGIGFSMGGAALLNAIVHGGSVKALIIDSTFEAFDTQVKRIFRRTTGFPTIPLYYVVNILFYRAVGCFMHSINSLAWAQQIKTPTMIIHSKNDELTAHSAAPQLFNALKGPKEAWYPEDASHAMSLKIYKQEYKERIMCFIEKYIL